MDPADKSNPQRLDMCLEGLLVPSETFQVDADAYREIEAALEQAGYASVGACRTLRRPAS